MKMREIQEQFYNQILERGDYVRKMAYKNLPIAKLYQVVIFDYNSLLCPFQYVVVFANFFISLKVSFSII